MRSRSDEVALVGTAPQQSLGRSSRLPWPIRFPVAVILNLFLSAVLYTVAAEYTDGALVSVAGGRWSEWSQVSVLILWRIFELGIAWFADYDSYELVALTVLSHSPLLYFLGSFYEGSSIALLSSLAIDSFASYLPFLLLRANSRRVTSATSSSADANPQDKEVITDITIQALVTVLAAAIYSVTLYGAYASFLPASLVTHFEGISSITAAHAATPLSLMPLALTLGFAARFLLFKPAAASHVKIEEPPFDPASATIGETFVFNTWNYSPRSKSVIARTLVVMVMSGLDTFIHLSVSVDSETSGAVAFSMVWVVAALATGAALGVVGSV